MSKIYETTIKLNAALGRQYAQTFAAAQKLTNGLSDELIDMQTKAANMSGLAALGGEIQHLTAAMSAAGGGTDEQKNKLKYLSNEYAVLSKQLTGTVMAYSQVADNAQKATDAFEAQEIAAKDLAQTQKALEDVKGVIAQRKEVERLKKLYERMPNKQLADDIKAQENALKRLESQTGLASRSMEQLENRQRQLIRHGYAKKFSEGMTKSFAQCQKAANVLGHGIGEAMKKAGKAIGVALAGATVAVAKFANDTGQKLADTEQRARQFGMKTDVFQGFEYSMKKNGVERDQYIDGLQTLQERMVEAMAEPGEMRDNFAKLGVTMDDLKHKNVGEVFQQIAGNAHMLQSEAEQTKFGLGMLGGEGGKIMAAMAKEGLAGMEKDFDEAKRMGAVATQDQIKNAMKYQDQVHQMGAAWSGITMTIGNAVLPIFTKLMDKVNGWLEENPDAVQKLGEMVANLATKIGDIFTNYIIPYIEPTIKFFQDWGPLLAGIVGTVVGFVGAIKAITAAQLLWNAAVAMNPMVLIIMAIIAAVALAVYLIVSYWGEIKSAFIKGFNVIKNAWKTAVDLFAAGIEWLVGAFLSIPDKIASLGSTLSKFFSGIWDGIKGTFVSMINWVIGKINAISFTVPDWVPDIGGQTIGANIPMLANGGIATRATSAIVGEGAEPEAILPLSKLGDLMGGGMGGLTVNVTQSINIGAGGDVAEQAKRGAASGAQDLATQIDAIIKRKYRLAM